MGKKKDILAKYLVDKTVAYIVIYEIILTIK